jgi:uncharacterized DUF497 family protein
MSRPPANRHPSRVVLVAAFDGAITFDPAKRAQTLQMRSLDLMDAGIAFKAPHTQLPDTRRDYSETRIISFARLNDRLMVIVYVARGHARHIISMRKANVREQTRYQILVGGDLGA